MSERRSVQAALLAVASIATIATVALVACGPAPPPDSERASGDVRSMTTGWVRCADADEPLQVARERCRWEAVATTERLRDGPPVWLERELGEEVLLAARREARAGTETAPATTVELGAWLEVYGAAMLYVDGVPVAAWGEPSPPPTSSAPPTAFGSSAVLPSAARIRTITVPDDPGAVLTLRYDPRAEHGLGWLSPTNGLKLWLGEPRAVQEAWRRFTRVASGHQLAFTAAFSTQALLHLLIFAFSRRVRSNAWFAVSCLLSASLVYVQFEVALAQDLDRLEWLYRIWGPLLLADMGVLLSFVYEAFDHPRRAWFWSLEAVAVVLGVYSFVVPDVNAFVDFWWFHLVVLVESVRVNVLAVRRGWSGAWIIATGLLLLGCALVWQQLLAQGKVAMPLPMFPVAYYGVAALLVSVSTYLSFHVGRLGRILRERLQQVEELSAKSLQQEREAKDLELSRRLLEVENERKSEELEAARAFQLSLLPRELPRVEGVDIAATMETATEVGGDYYDATVWPDGSLVVLMGDATGHGARAGSLVSLMKGMFVTLRPGEHLGRFLADASAAVRSMHLDRARLAMALLRLDGERLTFAAAGMPPALVVRSRTGQVEELMTPAMPLGGLSRRFPERETEVQPGDTVFLLSDGLFELPDQNGDPLGYDRVRALVAETVRAPGRGADLVVKELFEHARRWYGEGAYPDDITVVVLRSLAVPPGEQKGLVEAAAEHALSSF